MTNFIFGRVLKMSYSFVIFYFFFNSVYFFFMCCGYGLRKIHIYNFYISLMNRTYYHSIKCPYLFLVMVFVLKYLLIDSNIFILGFILIVFMKYIFYQFTSAHLRLCLLDKVHPVDNIPFGFALFSFWSYLSFNCSI